MQSSSKTALEKVYLDETTRLRTLIALAAIFYPLWQVVYHIANPDFYDPLFLRVLVSAIAATCYYLMGRQTLNLQQICSVALVAAYSLTVHFYYLMLMNDLSVYYSAGALVVVSTTIGALPSRNSVIVYGLAAVLSAGILTVFTQQSLEHDLFLIMGLITAAVTGGIVQFSRHATIDRLAYEKTESALILDNLTEGVVLQQRDGTIYSSNQAANRILGFRSHTIEGKKSQDPIWRSIREDGTEWDGSNHPAMVALRTGVPQYDQVMGFEHESGATTWISINAQPIFREGETLPSSVVASFQDITLKREADNLLQEQQLKLVGSAKMSALGEMAAGVAHEINNPLAIISGRSTQLRRVIEKQPIDVARAQQLIQNIDSTTERISKIINGLRSFARDGKNDPFTPNTVLSIVEETIDLCRERLIKNNIKIIVDIEEKDLTIECCRGEISQILLNLFQNAFDAMEPLETEKKLVIQAITSPHHIDICVQDTGPGIPVDLREKVLQPFFTTKAVGKGTGLGLSISMGIAQAHKGRLFIEDSTSGAKFVLRLPRPGKSVAAA